MQPLTSGFVQYVFVIVVVVLLLHAEFRVDAWPAPTQLLGVYAGADAYGLAVTTGVGFG